MSVGLSAWEVFALIYYLGKGQMYYLRYADLLYTYLLLAAVDLKARIVPDRILFLFFTGQLLMAGAEGLTVLTAGLLGNLIFGVVVLLAAATSSEKMGMGDGKKAFSSNSYCSRMELYLVHFVHCYGTFLNMRGMENIISPFVHESRNAICSLFISWNSDLFYMVLKGKKGIFKDIKGY